MGKPIGKHNDTMEHHADGKLALWTLLRNVSRGKHGRLKREDDRVTCEKIADAAVRSIGRSVCRATDLKIAR